MRKVQLALLITSVVLILFCLVGLASSVITGAATSITLQYGTLLVVNIVNATLNTLSLRND